MASTGSTTSDAKHQQRQQQQQQHEPFASSSSSSTSRVFLFQIDLNEIPSSPSSEALPPSPVLDAYEVVRRIHGNPKPAAGQPAELPTDARNVPCVCGRIEARGGVVVCDGCERWFHLSCAGMRSRQAVILEDWVCGGCLRSGGSSKRWPLGAISSGPKRSGVRLLDMNALPPSDGEGDGEDFENVRYHTFDEKFLTSRSLSAPPTHSNSWHVGNGFVLQRESGIVAHPVKSVPEGTVNRVNRNSEELDLNSNLKGRLRSTSNAVLRKKECARRMSRANCPTENQETLRIASSGHYCSSAVESVEPSICNYRVDGNVSEAGAQRNCSSSSQQFSEELPIQYEDFYILCLGEIDSRPSYHNNNQIWPIGYKSSWHDKITGSLFTCDVLDGGYSGPIFKVTRCPCAKSVIPNGSTVLLKPGFVPLGARDEEETDAAVTANIYFDEGDSIQMYLSDPIPYSLDHLLFSCVGNGRNDASDEANDKSPYLLERPAKFSSSGTASRGQIGEFFAEDRSTSLVWAKVSKTFVDNCREVYKQSGSLRFYCKHELDGTNSDFVDANIQDNLGSSAKFCSLSGPVDIPQVIESSDDLEASCKALENWLTKDRFGLDMEFVQEVIEQLPGVHACSGYEVLNKRQHYSTSHTVGSGLLLIKRKNDMRSDEDGLFKVCKRSRKQDLRENHESDVRSPPPGKPLSSKLPSELVGDAVQVWEFLWRFHEVLGMKEPLLFEELEEELINPWFDGLNSMEKIEKEIQENRDLSLHGSNGTVNRTLNNRVEYYSTDSGESSPQFIEIETRPLKEASQARSASHTYYQCTGVTLTKAHSSLLKVLIGELQAKVAALVDPNYDAGELKSRRGRKKDVENLIPVKKSKIDTLPINELTWPELARRYILAVSSMDFNLDTSEITSRAAAKVFRCLQGDGGVLCGSLSGVAGMEADALLLAEATRQICGSLKSEKDVWPVEYKESESIGACESTGGSGSSIPEWAQVLEPVRKLPTNVGTRIRKCIYDALDRDPPDWARKILEHSISKEVYKGNASGPTKKAVLSVLADVCGEGPQQKPDKGRKGKSVKTSSDMIMKQCRGVLRRAVVADEAKVFCNLLGTTSLNPNDNEDEGVLGSPAMVSRPLDFRTIDLRLSVGAYGGCHEAFLEDVREVWHNIRTAYGDRPDLMELAETLSQNFESLYENEVLILVQKFREHANSESLSSGAQKELSDVLACTNEIPKAPWDEGVCKVCGIDKDDESVLLCDSCDSEYHTYCLNPPLARIPEGNWYCPSCVSGQGNTQDVSKSPGMVGRQRRKCYQGEESRVFSEALQRLAISMEEKEYWELSIEERIFLLKFLCDEVLNSAVVREHLEQCAEISADLQQKLRSVAVELRNLKTKEDILAARATKENFVVVDGVGEVGRERVAAGVNNHGRLTGQRLVTSKYNNYIAFSENQLQLEDVAEENKNSLAFYSKSICEKHCNGDRTEILKFAASGDQARNVPIVTDDGWVHENVYIHATSIRQDTYNKQNQQSLRSHQASLVDDSSRGLSIGSDLNQKAECNIENNASMRPPTEVQVSCLSTETEQTHLGERGLIMPNNIQSDVIEAESGEANSLKAAISLLQDSVASIESQILRVSMRRDFLGTDAAGRLYWVLGRPGKRPWLVVDGIVPVPERGLDAISDGPLAYNLTSRSSVLFSSEACFTSRGLNAPIHEPSNGVWGFSSCFFYESDAEIQELMGWLRDNDVRERELKEFILQFQRLRSRDSKQFVNSGPNDTEMTFSKSYSEKIVSPISLVTRAATILEKKYGPCWEPEASEIPKRKGRKAKASHEDKMYRCECLEPMWPSRHHCLLCHQTFSSPVELEGHNDGKCSSGSLIPDESKENDDPLKGKGLIRSEGIQEACSDEAVVEASTIGKLDISTRLIKFHKKEMVCPYSVEDIGSKFIIKNSNKELVQEIGLIGSNGIPSFVPVSSPYVHDQTLSLSPAERADIRPGSSAIDGALLLGNRMPLSTEKNNLTQLSSGQRAGDIHESSKADLPKKEFLSSRAPLSRSHNKASELDGDCCIVPGFSLIPLVGKVSQILRRLKINLLEMDAALPETAFRTSKSHSSNRCAWRTFVKSADSILEMVKATIVFEDMIKTEYLSNAWWYWSSLSAAARTPTISALALRIYALDAALLYVRTPPPCSGVINPTDNPRTGKRRKDNDG